MRLLPPFLATLLFATAAPAVEILDTPDAIGLANEKLSFLLRKDDGRSLNALLPVPSQVARFIEVGPGKESADGKRVDRRFLSLENTLMLFLDQTFPGCTIGSRGVFRVIRDSDLEIEEEAEDLVREYQTALKQRRLGDIVRLKIEASMPR